MTSLKRIGAGIGATLCAALILAPGVDAQEREQEPQLQQCTVTVMPTEVNSGEKAVEVTVNLAQPIGQVVALEAGEESGIELASQEDLPRTDMATNEQPEAITMDESGSSVTVWLNTEDAQPGQHEVSFRGSEGQCSGSITIR